VAVRPAPSCPSPVGNPGLLDRVFAMPALLPTPFAPTMSSATLPDWLLLLCGAGLLYAALHDIAARTIPNTVPVTLGLCGVALRLLGHSLLPGLACAAGIFALAAFCWRRGWLGGGDVKLLAAVALVLPPSLSPSFLASVALAGGILALFYAALASLLGPGLLGIGPARRPNLPGAPLWRRALVAERWRLTRGAPLPYATAIAAGYLFTLYR